MSKIYVSEQANIALINYLKALGDVVLVTATNQVYPQISSHPDIYMCRTGCRLFKAKTGELGYEYPQNIAFNAACTGKYFLHNTNYTNPELLDYVENSGMKIIHVKQGYTKCSCIIVNENSLITADRGIAKACCKTGVPEVLLVSEGNVRLEGFDHGFIGGATGRVGDEIIFNGNLKAHPDYKKIKEFIEDRGLRIRYFADYPLTDIGSIIEEPQGEKE